MFAFIKRLFLLVIVLLAGGIGYFLYAGEIGGYSTEDARRIIGTSIAPPADRATVSAPEVTAAEPSVAASVPREDAVETRPIAQAEAQTETPLFNSWTIVLMLAVVGGFLVWYMSLDHDNRRDLIVLITRSLSGREKGRAAYGARAVVALSIASFYTTFSGMQNFVQPVWVAFLVALGIQVLLFVTSWTVAEQWANFDYARRLERQQDIEEEDPRLIGAKASVRPVVWVVSALTVIGSLFASVFFSNDFMFDNVYSEADQRLNNMKVAKSEIARVFDDLRDDVATSQREALRELNISDEMQDWEARITGVLQAASKSKQAIEDASAEARGNAERHLTAAQQEFEKKNEALATLRGQLKGLDAYDGSGALSIFDTISDRIASKRREIDQIQAEIASLDQNIQDEINNGGVVFDENRNPRVDRNGNIVRRQDGCGPVCRKLQADKRNKVASLERAIAEQDRLSDELDKARGQQEQKFAQRGLLEGQLTTAEIGYNKAKLDLDQAQARFDMVANSGGFGDDDDTGGIVQQVRIALSRFQRSGKSEDLNQVVQQCEAIFQVLSDNKTTRETLGGANCEAAGVSDALDSLQRYERAEVSLAENCVVDDSFVAAQTVQGLLDRGTRCISLSLLPSTQTADYSNTIERVRAENSPETTHFVRTVSTIRRGDTLALLALGIAALLDIFIFCAALASAFSARPEHGTREAEERALAIENATTEITGDEPNEIYRKKLVIQTAVPSLREHGMFEIDLKKPEVVDKLTDVEQRDLRTQLNIMHARGHSVIHHETGADCFFVEKYEFQHLIYLVGVWECEAERGRKFERETGLVDIITGGKQSRGARHGAGGEHDTARERGYRGGSFGADFQQGAAFGHGADDRSRGGRRGERASFWRSQGHPAGGEPPRDRKGAGTPKDLSHKHGLEPETDQPRNRSAQ